MNNYLKENWFKVLAAVILIIGFGNNPYSYYQFERWAVLIIGGYAAYLAYKNKETAWTWIFAIIAILFNPIVPFYMARGTWQLFDLAAAVLFLIPIPKTKPSAESK
jgi:hypothetical protein